MLSVHEELLKLLPVDASAKPGVAVDRPPDLIEHWRQIASAIAEVAAGQRRTVEQLEGFLESVRTAAAETQRTAAASRAHLEDERAAIEKDRAALRALLEKMSSAVSAERAQPSGSDTSLDEVRSPAIAAQIGEIRSAVATELAAATETLLARVREERAETLRVVADVPHSIGSQVGRELRATIEPLAATAVDFRQLAVALDERLTQLETLKATLRSDANAVRSAVSEELLHRHQEMEKVQKSAEDSASAAAKQLSSAVDSIREALANHVEGITRDDRRLTEFITEMRQTAEAESLARVEAEAAARSAAEAEARSRPAAEATAEEAERVASQLQATSTSMMAFLEVLDDVLALPSLENDAASRRSVSRLTTRAQRVLEAAGLAEIRAEGQMVDAELHEIVGEIPASADRPAGRVVKVVQRGFRNADRVLRRAQVVAAR